MQKQFSTIDMVAFRRPRRLATAALMLVVPFVASCAGGRTDASRSSSDQIQTTPATLAPGPSETLHSLQQHFIDLVNLVRPSVVKISTKKGLGSGVVYDSRGDVVTNAHVVDDATQFQVMWFDGTVTDASLVGKDESNDLAAIRVSRGNGRARVATLGDSNALQTGDIALAIGNPLGLDNTVTEGIVSATQRTVAETNAVVLHVLQTSAPINPGNSGGALVDVDGQLIGVPTLAAQDPDFGLSQAGGIGFAIPSNTVKTVADRLIAAGP